ncbi:MAG: hypothetical protein OEV64_05815 [Desulfobulbaceae bacterium]|nr:hypothetical protein [Desulfobulbaceae bacterium]
MALPSDPVTISTLCIGATLVCVLGCFCLHWYRLCKQRHNEIWVLQRELQAARRDLALLKQESIKKEKFLQSLSEAQVTNRFQTIRAQRITGMVTGPPEKYRYLTAMIRAGIPVNDIADILDISPMEVNQLLTLAKIAGNDR